MGINIIYCGHSAVLCEFSNFVIAIDPWLENNPLCPAQLKHPKKIDAIVLTHGHSDHASEAASLAIKTGAKLLATYELAVLMMAAGVPEGQVVPMNKGGTTQLHNINISLTHAIHSNSYDSPTGTHYAGEACGVVLSDEYRCIYHAGDTELFSDMQLIAELYKPNIALLPIGDRFTMGPKAAAMAARLLKVSNVIPIHYKTFPLLTGSSTEFAKYLNELAPGCQLIELEPGQNYNC